MKNAPLKLFIDELYLSPYTYSVLSALIEKKIAYELHGTHFEKSMTTDPDYAGLTFTDLIPGIVDDGLVLSESLAILEYLEEKFPAPGNPSLYPADRKDRARARMLLSWYRCGMQGLRNERSAETIYYPELRAKAPLTSATQEEVSELNTALLQILKPDAEFLFESRWSIADNETAFMLHRLIMNGDAINPRLKTYAEGIWKRASVKAFVDYPRKAFRSMYS